MAETIGNKYHVPVGAENDGKAAAIAELWLGNLKNVKNGAAIVLGTGVGGGLIINKQPYYGSHFQAGELSMMDSNFESMSSDRFLGCSGSAVNLIKKINKQSDNLPIDNGLAAFEAIKNDPVCMNIFKNYCQYIARLILNLQSVVDLERIVIGGGISVQPLVIKTINSEYDKIIAKTPIAKAPLIKEMFTRPEIINAKFKNDANLYGALYSLLLQIDGDE